MKNEGIRTVAYSFEVDGSLHVASMTYFKGGRRGREGNSLKGRKGGEIKRRKAEKEMEGS